ncbi:unnamed protein product [Urochloa decumbens]|uniref:Transposase n=1 Tax=Urochloa decumbens TaxID=240449 RepID=A0ABC9CWV4_9POAL
MEASRSQLVSGNGRGGLIGSSRDGGQVVGSVGDGDDVPAGAAAPPRTSARNGRNAGNIECVWNHGTKLSGQGFKCGYYGCTNGGGGATRLRDHLGCMVGEVKSCPSVPRAVRDAMRAKRQAAMDNKKEKEQLKLRLERDLMQGAHREDGMIDLGSDEEDQARMEIRKKLRDKNFSRVIERRGGSGKSVRVSVGNNSVTAFFDKDLARSRAPVQPRIDTTLLDGCEDELGLAWAKWFHANDIAGFKADCPYFQNAIRLTQKLGTTARLPTSRGIDGKFLQANFDEAEQSLEIFKKEFIYQQIKKVVAKEIGPKLVVQIITDNGSNYKKACEKLVEEYNQNFWQPCAAHTINLMLKDIGKFRRVANVVASAKQICMFLYNHNRLHDEMRRVIGGELIRPNATRFGTVFMFLQSFLDKKDGLQSWMVSKEWKESDWKGDEYYEYTQVCLENSTWWRSLKWVVDSLRPLYLVLRYADTQRNCTLSGFKPRMMAAIHAMEAHLGEGSPQFRRFMSKVSQRVRNMETNTLMIAAAVLDPETHYTHNFSNNPEYAEALTDAIEKMAETPEDAVQAIQEIGFFRECHGRFNRPTARAGALSMSPTDWWFQFGGEVPTLQKYALRIVSQCVSSSGCERNWSTFALVHTKIRNKLSYDKLHKLVYVQYNLKERIQEKTVQKQKEVDPCAMMLDAALFDETNPIWDWLDKSMSGVGPSLDDLYPSRLDKPARGRKGKRVRVEEEEEIDFLDSETGDEEDEYEDPFSDDESARVNSGDDGNGDELAETSPMVEANIEAPDGRSRSGRPLKKKRVNSLY